MNVDKLQDVLLDAGYESKLVEGGTELTTTCPICFDEKKRMYISTETGLWCCFKCDERGNLLSLLREGLNLPDTQAFTLEHSILRREVGVRASWPKTPATEIPSEVEVELPPGCVPDSQHGPVVRYLDGRGINPTLRWRYNITFCYLGICRYRVVVPVVTEGKLRTWVARTTIGAEPKIRNALDSQASRALFNYDNITPGPVIVVEGVFDALRLISLGCTEAVVATLGGHVTDTQRRLLRGRNVTLLRDKDAAGLQSAIKDARELMAAGIATKIAVLPKEGSDPGSADPADIKWALDHAQVVDVDYGSEVLQQVHYTQDH